jgi:hypothetical protein
MRNNTAMNVGIALLLVGILSTCNTAFANDFQEVDYIPEGAGLVYIYSPYAYSGVMDISYEMAVGNDVVTGLRNNSYYPIYVKPGKITFNIRQHTEYPLMRKELRSVDFEVKPGATYYVKFLIHPNTATAELKLVANEVGEKEILKSKFETDND